MDNTVIDGRDRYVVLPVTVCGITFYGVFDRKANNGNSVEDLFFRKEQGKAQRLAEKLNKKEQNHA